jgi:hypothetical protein
MEEISSNGNSSTRRCYNCSFWKPENEKLGKCSARPFFFAYSLAPNLLCYTKHFFVCDNHRYESEDTSDVKSHQEFIEEMNNVDTYFNKNGFPILRKCMNCLFWEGTDGVKLSECSFHKMYFAFSNDIYESRTNPMTKEFFVCENHKLIKEEKIKMVSDRVKLKDIIKKREDISNSAEEL